MYERRRTVEYKDIQGETICYVRAKTKETEDKEAIIKIPVTDPILKTISDIRNPDKRRGSYVFAVMPNGPASTVKRRTNKILRYEERIADHPSRNQNDK